MTVRYLASFQRDFAHVSPAVIKKFKRQINTLLQHGITYPGLNIRKVTGHSGMWEARIDYHYRFTFEVVSDVVVLRRIGTHEIYHQPYGQTN